MARQGVRGASKANVHDAAYSDVSFKITLSSLRDTAKDDLGLAIGVRSMARRLFLSKGWSG